jgi:hypothetical protein
MEESDMKNVIVSFLTFFVLTFITASIVGLLYNLIAHGSSVVDWGTSIRLAIILGVVHAWSNNRKKE